MRVVIGLSNIIPIFDRLQQTFPSITHTYSHSLSLCEVIGSFVRKISIFHEEKVAGGSTVLKQLEEQIARDVCHFPLMQGNIWTNVGNQVSQFN